MASTSTGQSNVCSADENMERKVMDMNKKLLIASHIVRICDKERRSSQSSSRTFEETIAYYTSMDQDSIKQAKELAEKNKKTIEDIRHKQHNSILSYENVRQLIVDRYINYFQIPTRSNILTAIKQSEPTYDKSQLDSDLWRTGFTWVRIPNTDRTIIVERPDKIIKINRYLLQMAKYREEHRNIIYIYYRYFFPNGLCEDLYTTGESTSSFVIVANGLGLLNFICYNDFNESHLMKFVTEFVLPFLSPSSVINIPDKGFYEKTVTPNEFSTKREMLQWLSKHEIVHDSDTHKADLYQLIKSSKRNFEEETYKLDNIVKGYGHEVIRRPHGFEALNYYKDFMEKVEKNLINRNSVKHVLTQTKDKYTSQDWKSFEDKLIAREKKIFEENMQMEVVVDQLLTMAREGDINIFLNDPRFNFLDTELCEDEYLEDIFCTQVNLPE